MSLIEKVAWFCYMALLVLLTVYALDLLVKQIKLLRKGVLLSGWTRDDLIDVRFSRAKLTSEGIRRVV